MELNKCELKSAVSQLLPLNVSNIWIQIPYYPQLSNYQKKKKKKREAEREKKKCSLTTSTKNLKP